MRDACETCFLHGKNFACPPYSSFFPDWVKGSHTAKVIFLRFPADAFDGESPEGRANACNREARLLLSRELLEYQKKGYKVAGAGPCRSCEICGAAQSEEECRAPVKRIYSLESMGVNVVELTKRAFDIDLDWEGEEGAMIGAVGCVFDLQEKELLDLSD